MSSASCLSFNVPQLEATLCVPGTTSVGPRMLRLVPVETLWTPACPASQHQLPLPGALMYTSCLPCSFRWICHVWNYHQSGSAFAFTLVLVDILQYSTCCCHLLRYVANLTVAVSYPSSISNAVTKSIEIPVQTIARSALLIVRLGSDGLDSNHLRVHVPGRAGLLWWDKFATACPMTRAGLCFPRQYLPSNSRTHESCQTIWVHSIENATYTRHRVRYPASEVKSVAQAEAPSRYLRSWLRFICIVSEPRSSVFCKGGHTQWGGSALRDSSPSMGFLNPRSCTFSAV